MLVVDVRANFPSGRVELYYLAPLWRRCSEMMARADTPQDKLSHALWNSVAKTEPTMMRNEPAMQVLGPTAHTTHTHNTHTWLHYHTDSPKTRLSQCGGVMVAEVDGARGAGCSSR
jgi:hypothetical protein